ncbi:Transposase DDE domain protein [Crateriforma conspicua]|uniref:Transposase DDE domain protein n=2 Tax=Crateriforma conspicua TaxID=2527996 RepID=A0A5C6FPH7_9PLAN|nr:Transposase DDE domain protein [Crateriforma conspicua]
MLQGFAQQALKLFTQQSPVCVMVRGVLENLFSEDRLNDIFENHAVRQYSRELSFSACVSLMTQVVTRTRPSLHAAYKAQREEIAVSINSVYNKINGIETQVSEAMVAETANVLRDVVDTLGPCGECLAGRFEVRIIDGNHLAGTDHRIAELRKLGAAALPGHSVSVLDPKRQLIEAVVTSEDGHSSERLMIPAVLEHVQPKQCWMGDANFCTRDMLFGVRSARGHFIVRQHGQFQGQLTGRRRKIGASETGMVYEQSLTIEQSGRTLEVRRVTIERDEPTRKGKTEVHILSSLPASISAIQIAEAYRNRWTIESAFQDITVNLRSEINTLGYPDAALFGYCVALMLYNVLSVVQSALLASAARKPERNLSLYAIADEVSGVWRGLSMSVPAEAWTDFARASPKRLAALLQRVARNADIDRLMVHKWSPKKKQPKRKSGNRGNHVATQKILNQRT